MRASRDLKSVLAPQWRLISMKGLWPGEKVKLLGLHPSVHSRTTANVNTRDQQWRWGGGELGVGADIGSAGSGGSLVGGVVPGLLGERKG